MLPSDEDFNAILHSSPPPGSDWVDSQKIFVADYESGLLKQVDSNGLDEYLWGGEYDAVLVPELEGDYV